MNQWQLSDVEQDLFNQICSQNITRRELKEMDLSESLQYHLIKKDLTFCTSFKNPTPLIQLKVIQTNPKYGLKLKQLTEEMYIEIVKQQPHLLEQIKKEKRTYNVCYQALLKTCHIPLNQKEEKGARLGSVPKSLRTDELINLAIRSNGTNIKLIDSPSIQLQRLAVQNNLLALEFVDTTIFNEKELLKFLTFNPSLLKHLKVEQQTPTLTESILKINGLALKHLKRNPSQQEMEIAFQQNPHSCFHFKNPSPSLLFRAIKASGNYLIIQNPEYKTPYWWEVAIKSVIDDNEKPWLWSNTIPFPHPSPFIDFLKAMKGILPQKILSPELSIMTLQNMERIYPQDLNHLKRHFPSEIISNPMIETLINNRLFKPSNETFTISNQDIKRQIKTNGLRLQFVSQVEQTRSLCLSAFNQNPAAIQYMTASYKTYRMCRYAIQQEKELIQFSPYHLSDWLPDVYFN